MDSFNIQNYFKRGKTVVLTLRHGDDEGARNWSDKETNDLIKQMKNFLPEFQNQRRRKKEVWEDVATELQKYGNSWTPEDCRKKWSNMIRTFKGIEEQKNDPTSKFKGVKWPFYDTMYHVLSLHGSDNLPECLTVVQRLKHGSITITPLPSGSGSSGSGIYTRKANPLKPSTFAAPNVNAPLHSSLIDSQQSILQLSHPDDVMSLGVSDHHGSSSDLHTSDGLDSNLLFDEPVPSRYPKPEPPPVTSSATISSYSKSKTVFAARPKKRPLKKKLGKVSKNSSDEPVDSILEKFIEDTKHQNEMMLDKLTSFHDNTVTLMQERNDLLREIRDSLQEGRNSTSDLDTSMGGCDGQGPETLTLHVPFSTNETTITQSGESLVSQLSTSTLVLSDAEAASALSNYHIVDETGTVLTSLNGEQRKAVLANFGSFTDAGISSLLQQHPTLVSVVPEGVDNQQNINLMAPSTAARKNKRIKRDLH